MDRVYYYGERCDFETGTKHAGLRTGKAVGISDTTVRLKTLEEVLHAKAYICMYEWAWRSALWERVVSRRRGRLQEGEIVPIEGQILARMSCGILFCHWGGYSLVVLDVRQRQ